MKIIQLLKNVRRTDDNEDGWVDPSAFKTEFDAWHLEIYDFDDRFKCYWIGRHYCTDTHVGIRAYYLDDEPVAASYQGARKADEHFEWVSRDAANKVLDYMKKLAVDRGQELTLTIMDPEEDLGDGYQINYAAQVMDYTVIYDGKEYPVDKKSTERGAYTAQVITIEMEDGPKQVELGDCVFPWKITSQEKE